MTQVTVIFNALHCSAE